MHNDNDATTFETRILACIAATRRMIDPGRTVMAASSPYMITGGEALDAMQLICGGEASRQLDADLIHLEISRDAEMAGPVNVQVAMSREPNIVFFRMQSRFWLDPRGRPSLICRQGDRYATMSFDPDGMDSQPGRPEGSLEKGYARADRLLRRYAQEALAAKLAKAA